MQRVDARAMIRIPGVAPVPLPLMKVNSAVFNTSSLDLAGCPAPDLPEFALIGRSNVGKSSLLNMITGKKDLAKVSETPGKTKLLNFFTINNKWRLVDLPGYGFAQTAKDEVNRFNESVVEYLTHRGDQLICVLSLIDSRHAPQKIDLEFIDWMIEMGVPFVLVFTKTDKITAAKLAENLATYKEALSEMCETLPEILTCSSKTGSGHRELLRFVDGALP